MTWLALLLILAAIPSLVLVGSLLIFIWIDRLFPDPDTQDRVFNTMVLANAVVWAPTTYRWGTQVFEWAGGLFA